jgi:hypothetical protein
MNTFMAIAAVLSNLVAISPITYAEANKQRNSAVFIGFIMCYGMAHTLTSTVYVREPMVSCESAQRYMVTDYFLIILFMIVSDEFHSIPRVFKTNSWTIVLLLLGFILSDAIHLMELSPQWYRLIQCIAECTWRVSFFRLIRLLQEHAHK